MIHFLFYLHYRKAYAKTNIIAYFISQYATEGMAQVMPLSQLSHFNFYIVSFQVYSYVLKFISMDNI